METILTKTHIIYCTIIICIASIAYHFFKKAPATITKTVTQVQVVNRDKIVYIDRTIVTKKKDGTIITEVDHSHSDTVSKSINKVSKTDTETFLKNYSVEAMFPIYPQGNPLDTQLSVGLRIFSLPIFAVVGSDLHFNKVLTGLRIEF